MRKAIFLLLVALLVAGAVFADGRDEPCTPLAPERGALVTECMPLEWIYLPLMEGNDG